MQVNTTWYGAHGDPVYSSEYGVSCPLRYAGYYYDADTRNYYLKNRYYNSYSGRFLTEDPYWNVSNMLYGKFADSVTRNVYLPAALQSLNRYAYCMGNPVAFGDPTGLAGFAFDEDGSMSYYDSDAENWRHYTYDGKELIFEGDIDANPAASIIMEVPNYYINLEVPTFTDVADVYYNYYDYNIRRFEETRDMFSPDDKMYTHYNSVVEYIKSKRSHIAWMDETNQINGKVYNAQLFSQGNTDLCWAYTLVNIDSAIKGVTLTQNEANIKAKQYAVSIFGPNDWNRGVYLYQFGRIVGDASELTIKELISHVSNMPVGISYSGNSNGHIITLAGAVAAPGHSSLIVQHDSAGGVMSIRSYSVFQMGFYGNLYNPKIVIPYISFFE